MAPRLDTPNTIAALRTLRKDPHTLGTACGELLYAIPGLVSYHLNNSSTFRNNPVKAVTDTREFTKAADTCIHQLRIMDGVTAAFPDDLKVDRKQRRPRRQYRQAYITFLESELKNLLAANLRDILAVYNVESTQEFNKGLDFGMNKWNWPAYPKENVILGATDGDWNNWLKVRCEELEKRSVLGRS